MISME